MDTMTRRPRILILPETARRIREIIERKEAAFKALPQEEQAERLKEEREAALQISQEVAEEARQRRASMNPYGSMCQCGRGCFRFM